MPFRRFSHYEDNDRNKKASRFKIQMQQCPIVGITNIANAVFEEYTMPVKTLTKNAVEDNAAKQDSVVNVKVQMFSSCFYSSLISY